MLLVVKVVNDDHWLSFKYEQGRNSKNDTAIAVIEQ